MSYVVLARKWRPQLFTDLTGQQHVARTLANAIEQDRVAHALLFTGARGVGKTSTARILAMALNCKDGPTTTPCGACDSCREIQQGRSVDVLEIDGASNRGINEIRELRDGVRYAPQRDRYKIYIIDEVHMLTTEAFNALLKTLEEPPGHVVFVFATTEPQKIPVTILSRCQRFDFRRIPHGEIVGRLREITDAEGITVTDEVLALIARQADGGMRDALSLLDQIIAFATDELTTETVAEILGVADRRRLFELSRALVDRDLDAALGVLEQVTSYGTDLTYFAGELVAHLRDLVVVAASRAPEEITTLTDAETKAANEQVRDTSVDVLHRMFEQMIEAAERISRSTYPRLVFEMALVRMVAIEPVRPLDELIGKLEAIAAGTKLPGGGTTSGSSGGRRSTKRDDPPAESVGPAEARSNRRRDAQPQANTVAAPAEVETSQATAEKTGPEAGRGDDEATGADHAPEREPDPAESRGSAADAATSRSEPPDEAAQPKRSPAESLATEPGSDPPPADADETKATSAATSDEATESAPLDPAEWRELVEQFVEERPSVGRVLAQSALVTNGSPQATLAVPDALLRLLTDEMRERVVAAYCAAAGRAAQLRFVEESAVPRERAESAYRVVDEEEMERRTRREMIVRFVKEHPTTNRVLERWPDATLRVRVDDHDEEEAR